ncbi:MAG: hypothetical protein AAFU79_22110 [Myxococcota bacterium]
MTPVAEWFTVDGGVRARAGSGEGLPFWNLNVFFAEEAIGAEAEERTIRGERCWSVGNGYMACSFPDWNGMISGELCGDRFVYEILESDWEELPPGVYEFAPRED